MNEEEKEIQCAYNQPEYFRYVKSLFPYKRATTIQYLADKLINVCEELGITLKDFKKVDE